MATPYEESSDHYEAQFQVRVSHAQHQNIMTWNANLYSYTYFIRSITCPIGSSHIIYFLFSSKLLTKAQRLMRAL